MKRYEIPKSIAELVALLNSVSGQRFYLAGGTDLIVGIHQTGVTDYTLIDISYLAEYRGISETEDMIKIGALTTMRDLAESATIKKWCAALAGAGSVMGSQQIRNRATVGGNIMNAAQCSDTLPCLYAYDAQLEILTKDGTYRRMPIRELVTGICKTTLAPDEMVAFIYIKKRPNYSGFSKIGARRFVTISKLNACLLIEEPTQSAVKPIVTMFMGAVGVKPLRATILEEAVQDVLGTGVTVPELTITPALKDAGRAQIEAAIPTRVSKYYKRVAVNGLLDDIFNQWRQQRSGNEVTIANQATSLIQKGGAHYER